MIPDAVILVPAEGAGEEAPMWVYGANWDSRPGLSHRKLKITVIREDDRCIDVASKNVKQEMRCDVDV